LGFPLLASRIKKSDFEYVIDRAKSRLVGWNLNLLSRARRTTLAKSMLNSIHVYLTQNSLLPNRVRDEIDKITRTFI